jgi:hypothetical protein
VGTGGAISFGNQTAAGTYTVETVVQVIGGSSCTAQAVPGSTTVTIDALATTSVAGPTQTLCDVTTATLAGNTPAVGTGAWSTVGGSGTVTTPTSPTSGVTGLGAGNDIFRWTITNGTCSNFSDVTITRNTSNVAPTSLTASSNPICNGSSCTLTEVGGTLGTGAAWNWYSDPTYTTFVGTGASISVSPSSATTYYIRAEGAASPCTANTPGGNKIVNVNPRLPV